MGNVLTEMGALMALSYNKEGMNSPPCSPESRMPALTPHRCDVWWTLDITMPGQVDAIRP